MNLVVIKGNLTRDPEVRYTPNGSAVCSFSVAINEVWIGQDNEKRERVHFVEVDFWGKSAENIGQFFHKGKPILVTGRLKQESWDDKQTGQKRSKLKVHGDRWEFCGDTKAGDQRATRPATGEEPQPDGNHEAVQPDADDVPF